MKFVSSPSPCQLVAREFTFNFNFRLLLFLSWLWLPLARLSTTLLTFTPLLQSLVSNATPKDVKLAEIPLRSLS